MIGMKAKVETNFNRVVRKAKDATFRSLGHAVATIRTFAKRSIRKSKKPSAPGRPPHTRNKRLSKAILYAVDKRRQMAVVGPAKHLIGLAGAEHEHGGRFREETFRPRPFMNPALEKNRSRLPKHWAGSLAP